MTKIKKAIFLKILLVYPEYPRTYWSFHYALKFVSKKASFPPLGLLTVAAMLPGNWEKKLVDMNVDSLSERELHWADLVFISAMVVQKTSAAEVISRCRKLGVPTVAGGPLFTTEYEAYSDVDFLVLGEAEMTLPRFLKDFASGRARHIYTAEEWPDIEQTPLPLWELVDMKKYVSMNLQYSRGCPFQCDFCNITALYGRVPRTKNREQVIRELEAIYRRGWRGTVFFVDDNFIGNKKKLKDEMLPVIIEWMERKNYPFTFITETSINLSDDPELMEMMVRAGFDTVFVGIETPYEESLAECSKYQNRNRDLIACVRKMLGAGLQVQGGFIVGFDHDPASIFEKLIHFIQESGIVTAMVGLLNAPRGTKLYQRLAEEGRLLKEFTGDNTDFSMNFVPKMNYEVLVDGYKKVVGTIYSPRAYYGRVREFLVKYQPRANHNLRVGFREIQALVKSFIILGISERERLYYWKLILWSLFTRPRLFPLAVQLSIYGFHFRKVYES